MSFMSVQRAAVAALAVAGMVVSSTLGLAAEASPVKAVVELFTSQGCSSCPPADRILAELARDPDTLAISLPVDYWDYIGWKDTLAEPVYTARQRAYARTSGRGEVYTPQAIINGVADAVGSDRAQIATAEAQTLKRPDVLSTPLSVSEQGGSIAISIGAAPSGRSYKAGVYLIALASKRTVAIKRGENAGSTLTYSNVARAITKIGEWTGAPIVLKASLDQARLNGADSYAVIVQEGGRSAPSAILAAAKGPPPPSL
ncbi:MAG TPA: DUF1223 domain-containing protein [Roseiarcus sp.]|nr:DUF1223 domain-containing protein [Roseiarcus sp.]